MSPFRAKIRLVVQFDQLHHSQFHENNLSVSEAVAVGWTAFRGVLRSWGVRRGEDMTCWFREHEFPGAQPGNHFTARAQECMLQQASAVDARVAVLESVFETVALHMGRQEHSEGNVPPTTNARSTGQPRSVSNCWSCSFSFLKTFSWTAFQF